VHLLIGPFMAGMIRSRFLALKTAPVAYMIAVKRSSLLFSIACGAWLFGEERSWQHLSAAAVIVAGIVMIAAG
jgi:drug/metabolite transporter (DMT)-like permease